MSIAPAPRSDHTSISEAGINALELAWQDARCFCFQIPTTTFFYINGIMHHRLHSWRHLHVTGRKHANEYASWMCLSYNARKGDSDFVDKYRKPSIRPRGPRRWRGIRAPKVYTVGIDNLAPRGLQVTQLLTNSKFGPAYLSSLHAILGRRKPKAKI